MPRGGVLKLRLEGDGRGGHQAGRGSDIVGPEKGQQLLRCAGGVPLVAVGL
jgi:hypothetical protein